MALVFILGSVQQQSSADTTVAIEPSVILFPSAYLNEFSNSGESASLASTWQVLTVSGSQIEVAIYSYCMGGVSGCTNVAFDVTDGRPLNFSESYSIFEAIGLYNLNISNQSYTNPFQSSVTCSIAAPDLDQQSKNAAADAADKLSGLLPENAADAVKVLTELGDAVGVIDHANYPLLALGAVCAGSYYFEDYVSSQLQSCQSYLQDLSNHVIYEGIAEDFISCNTNAINNLNDEIYNPDVLFQTGETEIGNAGIAVQNGFQSSVCTISNLVGHKCTTDPIPPNKSMQDTINSEVATLQSISAEVSQIGGYASQNSNSSVTRVEMKQTEAEQSIAIFNSEMQLANSKIGDHTSILGSFSDWFYSPEFNLTDAQNNESQATSFSQQANSYYQIYRYNSAIGAASEGSSYANAAIQSLSLSRHHSTTIELGHHLYPCFFDNLSLVHISVHRKTFRSMGVETMSNIGKLIGLIFSLMIAIIFLVALAPVYGALFGILPQPASTAVSTYSALQDATEIAAIMINIIGVFAAILGFGFTRDIRVTGVIVLILFLFFLATGL